MAFLYEYEGGQELEASPALSLHHGERTMTQKFESLLIEFDVLEQFRMCESCHWSVGIDHGPVYLCCRCKLVEPAAAKGRFGCDEMPHCWRCLKKVRLTPREHRTLSRREVFCRDCFRIGVHMHNALEYIEIARGRRSYLSDE